MIVKMPFFFFPNVWALHVVWLLFEWYCTSVIHLSLLHFVCLRFLVTRIKCGNATACAAITLIAILNNIYALHSPFTLYIHPFIITHCYWTVLIFQTSRRILTESPARHQPDCIKSYPLYYATFTNTFFTPAERFQHLS